MSSTIFLIAFLFITGASHPSISINLPAARQEKTAAQLTSEGMAAYRKKDYALAAKLLQQAIDKGATQSDVFYNAACALALNGERDRAFQFIEKSIEAGYRNPIHLKNDVDLNSLHDDPRWEKVVAACESAHAKFRQEHGDPANARFIGADVARFWAAYDKALAAPVEERAAILQREYIEPGTLGLKDFAASGRLRAEILAKKIESHRAFFNKIRALSLALDTQRPATVAAFTKFKELFSYAIFPDVYLIIGQLSSGGTASSNGLLMGAEMFSRSPDVPMLELTDWERGAIMPADDIPPLVAHEAVHFQQKFLSQDTLLCACLVEGGADFLGKLSSGRLIARMEEAHKWANARERELWEEFRKEMDGKDTSHWLYGKSGGKDRPVDLGYWMGFKISEAYYNNASDKKQAVRDMLMVLNCKAFLKNSHYADKFAGEAR
jgi:Predicted Zn-dependent protease (DUF2268)/A/B hydrolase-like, N-terminal domain